MSEVGITDGSSVHLAIYSTDQVQISNIWYKYLVQISGANSKYLVHRSLGDKFSGELQGDLDETS